MAASIVAKSTMSVLSVLFLTASGVMAGTVAPSNSTLPTTESGALNALKLSGGALVDVKTYVIAPLTVAVGRGGNAATASVITFSGNAVLTDYSTTGNLTANDIAIISCDPNGSNIDASTVVGDAGALFPKAIVLYTLTGQACDLTVPYTYQSIFTMTSQRDSNSLVSTIHLASTTNSMTVAIGPSSPGSPGTSVGSTTANEGGPAPTTAVAMSILYSITGIITLLFLVIIATGAIRAHRHPERYGPRNGFPGRPRQSRAKGLARAMLETLPIVKFGDPEPVKPNQDVELEDGHAHTRDASVTSGITTNEAQPKISPTAADVASGMGAAQAESVKSGDENAGKEGELGCSICTEDFTTGEDVRVLPCNHKYHPACIDPWLLNVSGTCPLCRHDLRPVISNTENTEVTGTDGDELPPPLSINDGAEGHETDRASADDAPHRRRMSRFVDLRRLRNAPPDERIAALRTLREESQREAAPVENTEERSRRARLTGRLRDTFRIRTRTENSTSDPSSS